MVSAADQEPLPVAHRWLTTLTVLLGTLSVVLTTTIVNVAVPGIMADFSMSQMQAQWLSTGFLAAVTTTMLASAALVDRFGQRYVYMAAIGVFIAASLLGALSWSAGAMVAARIIQGAMAGVIQPLAMVIIFQVFPDHERGRAMGLYGMGVVLAPALGPVAGGVLLDLFGWRSVYLAALPFCVAGLLMAVRHLPTRRRGAAGPFDWAGLGLLTAGIFSLLGGLSEVPLKGLTPDVGLLIVAGAVMLSAFLWRERTARHPLVALGVFRVGVFAAAAVVAVVYGAGLFASTYLLPLLVQGVQGLSATLTGLVLMPAGLALAAVFPFSGRLSDRLPARRLIVSGLSLFAVAHAVLAFTGPATGFWMLALWIMAGRVGLGVMLPALNLGALRRLPDTLMQQGSGVINFARMLGGAFGVNGFAILLESRAAGYLRDAGSSMTDLHRFYDAAGGAAATATAAEVAALDMAFRDSFLSLALLFLVCMAPAWAMGVMYRRGMRRARAHGT